MYPINKDELIKALQLLGFVLDVKSNEMIHKTFNIKVTINNITWKKSAIDYIGVKVDNKGICNFTKNEYFTQLECVIRLLNKGYKKHSIHLERHFKIGRKSERSTGRLDICIYKNKKCWAMIECKTYGKEYNDEINETLKDGSQIFSYFSQDRKAETILIYTSKFDLINNTADFQSSQINTEELDISGDDQDIFNSWDKKFYSSGLFDRFLGLYETKKINIRKEDLIDLTRDTGHKLFHEFDEILRRNVISDKSNAFNIIFNLFVCKIYDEDTKSDLEELDFQIKIGDTGTDILQRLTLLYSESIDKYLSMNTDTKYLTNSIALKEFSFIDVFNDETFNENIEIIISVIKMLEVFRIKYSTKHQFMGEFFEHLLNTGVKQESGQFFTPIPLARFVLKSIPINDIINSKIKQKDPYILPHIIDYSCGSGHFLTEAIDEIDSFIPFIKESSLTGQQKRFLLNGKDYYLWARDYIYGIEKDHRLSKTTKIAMFLNGDGDAYVLSGDGLDDFEHSKYSGKLKSIDSRTSVNNFDIVASNPPYSVDNFSLHVKNIEKNFLLHGKVNNASSEIECFFIERTLQLLKEGGCSGLILPLSIFNNKSGIYTKTRELLLFYSQIVAVVELDTKTFMSTPTKTLIVFFKKRNFEELNKAVKKVVEDKVLETIVLSQLSNKTLENILFEKENGHVLSKIIEELNNNNILISYSGEKKRQEYFMGYRFTKGRKGEKGLNLYDDSMLYKFEKGIGIDTDYLNNHILQSFQSDMLPITGELQKHAQYINMKEIIENYSCYSMKMPSSFIAKHTQKIESISPTGDFIDNFSLKNTSIAELQKDESLELISGVNYKKKDEVPYETNVKVLTASNIDLQTGMFTFGDKMIYLNKSFLINNNQTIKKWDIIISLSSGSLRHLGKVAIADKNYPDMLVGGFLAIIRTNSKELSTAVYYRLMSKPFREKVFSKKGQNINNLGTDWIKEDLLIPTDLSDFFTNANKILNIK